MSIQTEIDRLNEAKAAIIAAIVAKGIVVVEGEKLDVMAEKIAQIATGVELPELGDTAAQPTDMVAGKVLYDDDGNVVTGTLYEIVEGKVVGASTDPIVRYNSDGSIYIASKTANTDVLVRAGAYLRATAPGSLFGDATADDVVKGKFFTSAAGVMVEGTMEAASGPQLPDGAIVVQIVKGEQASTQVGSGYSLSVSYADAVEINDSIALAFVGTAQTLSNISATTDFSPLMGKYVRAGGSYGSTGGSFYYIPDDATFTVGGQSMSKTLTCDKAQRVSLQKVII